MRRERGRFLLISQLSHKLLRTLVVRIVKFDLFFEAAIENKFSYGRVFYAVGIDRMK